MVMRIVFVAKHDSGGNDDEGAVMHALRELGHTVLPLREHLGHKAARLEADLCLFFKWCDVSALQTLAGKMARVFWYFDLVDWPDATLAGRCASRRQWMADVLPHVEAGFCTDGDWCAADATGKLAWLPQGADEQVVGFGTAEPAEPILFTGIARGGGLAREGFVAEMRARYGPRFRHVPNGVHGRALADLIAGAQIVVAPDAPVTSRYWSNRVYLSAGFGACLLHPYCERLTGHYANGHEVVYYRGRDDLHRKIAYYLERPACRRNIAAAALERTQREHLYRHRCAELLRIVRERGIA